MNPVPAVLVLGTFDSKGEEHLFLKSSIEKRGVKALTLNIGTLAPPSFKPDFDLFAELREEGQAGENGRDRAIAASIQKARDLLVRLHGEGRIAALLSAGGGTGTHMATSVMKALPLGVPKVMLSTVASRDMSRTVGTKDITMIHSVVDLLGVNSISGKLLDKAAGAVCGMLGEHWQPEAGKRCIALPFFGFVTKGAERARQELEARGYEVICFHANGTGGMAMEELAKEGRFHGILDFATHELADALMGGYCGGIGPERLEPPGKGRVPRLVVPGGMDCAVLEFTRDTVPERFKDRKIFFYDFRSAVRLSVEESLTLAEQMAEKLGRHEDTTMLLVPTKGWSEADQEGGPLYDPPTSQAFLGRLKESLSPHILCHEVPLHINEEAFACLAAVMMDKMLKRVEGLGDTPSPP